MSRNGGGKHLIPFGKGVGQCLAGLEPILWARTVVQGLTICLPLKQLCWPTGSVPSPLPSLLCFFRLSPGASFSLWPRPVLVAVLAKPF